MLYISVQMICLFPDRIKEKSVALVLLLLLDQHSDLFPETINRSVEFLVNAIASIRTQRKSARNKHMVTDTNCTLRDDQVE